MNRKKLLSLILAIVLSFGGIASANGDALPPDGGAIDVASISFFGEAAQQLHEPSQDDANYISSITLAIGEDTMVVNGTKISVAPPYIAEEGEALPVVDIAEALGAVVDIDDSTGEITIIDDGETTVIDTTADDQALPMCDIQEIADLFTLDVSVDSERITLTRPFQSKMLLLRMRAGKTLPDTYGADEYITDGNGQYVLKYDSISQTKEAYDAIMTLSDCQNIAPNLIIFTFDAPSNEEIKPFALPTPSWGTSRIRAGLMKEHLIADGKDETTVTVAVIDTGVNIGHPHLLGRSVPGRNFSRSQPGNPNYIVDMYGHGTHISGTIVDCTTENVKIMPVKVLDDYGFGDAASASNAIKWATDNGAKVINLSFGSTNFTNYPDWDFYFRESCDYAVSMGVAVVAAAGNANIDTRYVSPARLPNVITVSATDQYDKRAFFPSNGEVSNYGDAIDLAAPGTGILSSWLGNSYHTLNGTSMSTAHVSAAVAMISLDDPSLDPEGLKTTVCASTVDLGVNDWDRIYGAGVLDFRKYLNTGDVPATQIFLAPTSVTFEDYTQETKTWIDIYVNGNDATNKSFTVVSSNENVAVFIDGYVVPTGVGNAVITFSIANGQSATCTVTVIGESDVITSSLSGRVKTYNPGKETTIRLYQEGQESYHTIIPRVQSTGQIEQDFTIENILPGEYTLEVTKSAHTKYIIEDITIEDDDLDLTQNSHPGVRLMELIVGDIDDDGFVNVNDTNIISSSLNYGKNTEAAYNETADLDGDGVINVNDLNLAWSTANYGKGSVVISGGIQGGASAKHVDSYALPKILPVSSQPDYQVKVTGWVDKNVKAAGADSYVVDFMAQTANGKTIANYQSLRLSVSLDVFGLARWNGAAIDMSALTTALQRMPDNTFSALEDWAGSLWAAKSTDGKRLLLVVEPSRRIDVFSSPEGYSLNTLTSIQSIRLAFLTGKSSGSLNNDSIRLMNAEEIKATNQSEQVLLNNGTTTVYRYGSQANGVFTPEKDIAEVSPVIAIEIGESGSDSKEATNGVQDRPLTPPPPEGNQESNQEDDVETPKTPLAETDGFTAFINGYTDNTFLGANTMSREEFINILFKLNNPNVLPEADPLSPSFNDVASGRWSYNAIQWAVETGIVEIGSEGNFLPAKPITRAEIAVMLVRAEGWIDIADNIFNDIEDHPYHDDILIAVEAGIFRGYPDGSFGPDRTAAREEVVTALVRYLLGGEPTDDMWEDIPVPFVDVSRSHWAYKYVALATTGFVRIVLFG